jgi:hypothetical protein
MRRCEPPPLTALLLGPAPPFAPRPTPRRTGPQSSQWRPVRELGGRWKVPNSPSPAAKLRAYKRFCAAEMARRGHRTGTLVPCPWPADGRIGKWTLRTTNASERVSNQIHRWRRSLRGQQAAMRGEQRQLDAARLTGLLEDLRHVVLDRLFAQMELDSDVPV